jgi:hypothetical protein
MRAALEMNATRTLSEAERELAHTASVNTSHMAQQRLGGGDDAAFDSAHPQIRDSDNIWIRTVSGSACCDTQKGDPLSKWN